MTHRWSDMKDRHYTKGEQAELRRQMDQETLEVELSELREMAGKTQVEVAAAAGMSQSELSKFERRDDRLLSTLRRYVEALGGELQVVARIGDKTLRLRGV